MNPDFTQIAGSMSRCIWLDGGGAREWSRQTSLLGWCEEDDVSLTYCAARREVTRHASGRSHLVGDDPFAVLEDEMQPSDQWFGYFGYACRPDLPAAVCDDGPPDAVWMRPSHLRLVDIPGPLGTENRNMAREAFRAKFRFSLISGKTVPAAYADGFERIQHALRSGNTYETNLTYRHIAFSDLDPAQLYLRLRALNPAPYAGFLQHDLPGASAWLLSSSPERYALIDHDQSGGRVIETRPIKGTTPRGATPTEDEAQRVRLATDPKFRAENLMIADLLRNDVGMVCEAGTVEVPDLMKVESYASVHQLVTTVRGRLRHDVSTLEALRQIFPAGSMTGAPKRRTMEVIEAAETSPRGVYAGAFGWIGGDGHADLGVIIRSLTSADGHTWSIGTGGGITVGSDLAEEYAEAELKARVLLAALTGQTADAEIGLAP
ncbi:MAG: anthranilate synthase component I family protein [Nocardioides sp.]